MIFLFCNTKKQQQQIDGIERANRNGRVFYPLMFSFASFVLFRVALLIFSVVFFSRII